MNLVIWLLVLGSFEFAYKRSLIKEEQFNYPTKVITIEEFESRVIKGEKLVLVDELVLDVSEFMEDHPGGRFSIEHNIGRDVSKFFYGGYSLEARVDPHTHTNDARRILNELVVATLEMKSASCLMKADSFVDANSTGTIKSITFVAQDTDTYSRFAEQPCPITDLSQVGKHYLFKNTCHESTRGGGSAIGEVDSLKGGIKRHYTRSFCMQPNVYRNLITLDRKSVV